MAKSAYLRQGIGERLVRRTIVQTAHQAIACDALDHLPSVVAASWRRMFFRYGRAFAEGGGAPDVDFQDFRNHVLFPANTNFGGAVVKVEAWYRNLVAALRRREWRNSSYCAGVLAHYIIDALHPFHTGQSDAENAVHGAVDAAAWLGYPVLARQAAGMAAAMRSPECNAELVGPLLIQGARRANQRFEPLVAHFDLARAKRGPFEGFDDVGKKLIAETFAHAYVLLAAVLGAAIVESEATAPRVSLVGVGFVSLVGRPIASVSRWRKRRLLRYITRHSSVEFAASGRVEQWLGAEERAKRDAHSKYASLNPTVTRPFSDERNVVSFEPKVVGSPRTGDEKGSVIDMASKAQAHGDHTSTPAVSVPDPVPRRGAVVPPPELGSLSRYINNWPSKQAQDGDRPISSRAPTAAAAALGHAAAALLAPTLASGLSNFRDRRSTGVKAEPIMSVPIGPVDWLQSHDFQKQSGSDRGSSKSDGLAGLTGLGDAEAQLLKIAGYPDRMSIARTDVEKFCADVLSAALTVQGRVALQEGRPPDIALIRAWAKAAQESSAA